MRISDWSSDGVLFRSAFRVASHGSGDCYSCITYIGAGGIAGGVFVGSCCCALRRNAREASLLFGGIVSAIRIGINAAKRIVSAAADHAALGNRDACARLAIGIDIARQRGGLRSEEHTSELQSLMRISYAVFCLKKKQQQT